MGEIVVGEAGLAVLSLLGEGLSWSRLSAEQRERAGEALRDVYLAVRRGAGGDAEALDRAGELVRAVIDVVDVPVEARVGSLTCSWHPTRTHRMLRFVERGVLPLGTRGLFAEVPEAPGFVAAFVDPEALCYRTFENILPLDRLIAPQLKRRKLELERMKDRRAGDDRVHTFALRGPSITEALRRLDDLGLYVEPLNAGSRGGRRFIFHAATLAARLTDALRPVLPRGTREGFVHVNPVFRCNRFMPGDPPFAAHHDSPYYDARLHHSSRYTVLLYLTGGEGAPGAPALRVGEVCMDEIAPMTCVIFHQRHQHEGHPFVDGPKVFLRAELIYKHDPADHAHDPGQGALFSQACYLSGECLFAPELSAYTHDAYDRVAEAHWTGALGPAPEAAPEPFFCKTYEGASFVTSGSDYWARCEDMSLEELSALAIVDHFNAQIGGEAFRKGCDSSRVAQPAGEGGGAAWIPGFLASRARVRDERDGPNAPLLTALPKAALIPEAAPVDPEVSFPYTMQEYESWSAQGDMQRCEPLVALYEQRRAEALERLMHAPILLLGQEVFLDRSRFLIEGDRVHVLSHEPLRPLHFAAMYTYHYEPHELVGVEATVEAPYLLLPPMLFRQVEGCWHLTLDLFQNTWMCKADRVAVDLPVIKGSPW